MLSRRVAELHKILPNENLGQVSLHCSKTFMSIIVSYFPYSEIDYCPFCGMKIKRLNEVLNPDENKMLSADLRSKEKSTKWNKIH